MLARVDGCERKSAAERPRRKHVEAKGPSRGLRKVGANGQYPTSERKVPHEYLPYNDCASEQGVTRRRQEARLSDQNDRHAAHSDELTEVESAAEQAGKPLSEWLRETALRATRERPTDPLELVLAEFWTLRHVLLNLFYAGAKATAEGAVMSPESVLTVGDRTDARKLDEARKMLGEFEVAKDRSGRHRS
jgi:hypothetical protein